MLVTWQLNLGIESKGCFFKSYGQIVTEVISSAPSSASASAGAKNITENITEQVFKGSPSEPA
jgi:hypothetical protein